MRRFVMPLVWPVITGVLLAIVLLHEFPQLLGTPSSSPSATKETKSDTRDPAAAPVADVDVSRPAPQLREAAPLQRGDGPVSYADAVERAAPAVVNVYSSRVVEREQHPLMSDPFFRQFFGENMPRRQRLLSSLGSGVIVSEEGYVLTNNHVIQGADQIQVALRDGRETLATLIGTDPESDLAVLKIDLDDLPVIRMADSERIAVGDISLAIGNPFGVGQTVTMGIISATGRNHLGLSAYEDFIQTDAAINPGNSGGALVNADGALEGINTAIFSRSGGSQGIGFAIPTNLAREILKQIIQHGRVIRGWLGIEVQEITANLATSFGLKAAQGVVISSVFPGGPGDKAGLQPGDVMTSIDGKPIIDPRAAMADIAEVKPGASLPVTIIRGGERKQVDIQVGERPTPGSPGNPA
ncbi:MULTISPECIES: Do family serine endopeptidase [unclassified Modicisalibacter]|uniref:Do family serine endopeptidase n=1 Tax=unclassified Modicisalibacter TaxID=2679913 RepID=UPI001CCB3EAA|nr:MULTISPECIES: Do family serine endopeptidase [unclassified Modicisalibacter]MBZ9557177.1 Do family serine endopeptidase [Modicisalibacter sp. R2A 31.J]MBZ9574109.1 Do family serine endopeptidase [Modicisalibacter sp. MOD 31.J]